MPWLTTEGSSFYPAVFTIGFLWLSLALGRRLLILMRARAAASPIEQGVIAAALGAGVLQFLPFSLGLLGLLTTNSIRVTVGVLILAAAADLRAVAMAVVASIRRQTRPNFWTIAWLIALAPAVLMAGLSALAPTLDPDGLSYHLTVPKEWMYLGRLEYLPTYVYSNAPMGTEMLFSLGMAFAGDAAAKCIHYVLGVVVAAPAIYFAGSRLAGRMAGAVAATLFLVGPAGVVMLLGWAYVEGAAAAATATSALSWMIWYQTSDRGYLRCAALLAGIAVAFKITSVLFPVALLALTVLVVAAKGADERSATRRFENTISGLISAASLIPLVAIPILPWLTRALVLTGNPVYPLFANLIPTRDLPSDLATKVDNWNRYMTWGNSIGRGWAVEQRAWVLVGVAAVVALCGLFAFFKLRGRTARGVVIILTITSLVQLFGAGLYLRYWVPFAAVLMIPLSAAFAPMLSRRTFAWAWIGLTFTGSLAFAYRSHVEMGSNLAATLRTVAGLDDRADFVRTRLPLYALYERANRELPADAGILLSGYCSGFYIDRKTFCASMVQTSLRYNSWQDFTDDVRRLGITHVVAPSVLATGGPIAVHGGSAVAEITLADQYQMVRQLLEGHARKLATASDYGLYEITPELLAGTPPLTRSTGITAH